MPFGLETGQTSQQSILQVSGPVLGPYCQKYNIGSYSVLQKHMHCHC